MGIGRTRGFSLVELIVSIGIVGTSIILVVGIFGTLFKGSQKAADLTAGAVVADGLLSQTVYQVTASTDNGLSASQIAFFQASYATPTLYTGGTYQLNGNVYFYKIYVQDVGLGADFHDSDTDGTANQTLLKRFDAVVWWNDSSAASKTNLLNMNINQSTTGEGVLQVHQVRVVWPDEGNR